MKSTLRDYSLNYVHQSHGNQRIFPKVPSNRLIDSQNEYWNSTLVVMASSRSQGKAWGSKTLWCCRLHLMRLTFNWNVDYLKCHLVFICKGPLENGKLGPVTHWLPSVLKFSLLLESRVNGKLILYPWYLWRTLAFTKRLPHAPSCLTDR